MTARAGDKPAALCGDCGMSPRRPATGTKPNRLCQDCSDKRNKCVCGNTKSLVARTCQPCYFARQGSGPAHRAWKGGKHKTHGYIRVTAPSHPRAHANSGTVLEHRLVMEQHLGRYLLPSENVHHINGVRDDNRIENLELWSTAQPAGQRVVDKLRWAKEFISQYQVSPAVDSSLGEKLMIAAVDFDGTLAHSLWSPENRTREIGEPMWHNIAKLKELVAAGYSIVIHTARGWEDADRLEEWLKHYEIPYRNIVCSKPLAAVYCDDRAIHSEDKSWLPRDKG